MPETVHLQDVVAGCRLMQRDSQKMLYQYFYGYAMNICMRYSGVQDDAVEMINDGFLKIFRQLDTFSPRQADYEWSLKSWMKSIFVHTAIDHYRKYHKHQHADEVKEEHLKDYDQPENALDKLSYKEIIQLVQQLSPRYRTVFNMYVLDGYKHEEIATQLQISVGASKSNLSKAKANIQKMIKETYPSFYASRAI